MKNRVFLVLALSTAVVAAAPAIAQRSAYDFGNYTEISQIRTLPGQFENYVDYLNTKWKAQQAFAKSKGWILNYKILGRQYGPASEADLLLVTEFKDWPSTAEGKRRQDEMVAMMKQDEHQMEAASGQRGPMRTQLGQMLFQEIVLK